MGLAARVIKALPTTPAAPLEVMRTHYEQGELLVASKRSVSGLRNENSSHRAINAGAVQIEGINRQGEGPSGQVVWNNRRVPSFASCGEKRIPKRQCPGQ